MILCTNFGSRDTQPTERLLLKTPRLNRPLNWVASIPLKFHPDLKSWPSILCHTIKIKTLNKLALLQICKWIGLIANLMMILETSILLLLTSTLEVASSTIIHSSNKLYGPKTITTSTSKWSRSIEIELSLSWLVTTIGKT